MSNSTHRCEVVPVELLPHGNADSLSIVPVWGYSCVVRTADWVGIQKAIWIPPDSLVDVRRPEFSFLSDQANSEHFARIKSKKLRGVNSFGLLIPAPDDAVLGDDYAERLGVKHYEPGVHSNRGGILTSGEVAKPPAIYHVKYDLEAGRRYAKILFKDGEPVVVTEKLHGCNGRFVYHAGQMYCGSRTEWKKEFNYITRGNPEDKVGEGQKNLWWKALECTPSLRTFCEANPDVVVYGEVYGAVQDLNYGHKRGQVSFAAFDLMRDGRWVDVGEAIELALSYELPWVPVVSPYMNFNFDQVCELAEGPSLVSGANHIREGVVVRPFVERNDDRLGRVCLKWVSAAYLER